MCVICFMFTQMVLSMHSNRKCICGGSMKTLCISVKSKPAPSERQIQFQQNILNYLKENRFYSASTWFQILNNLRLWEIENRFNVKCKHTRTESPFCARVRAKECVWAEQKLLKSKIQVDQITYIYILQVLNMRTTQTGEKSNLFFVLWQVGIQQKSIDSWLIFVMITYHSFFCRTCTSEFVCKAEWMYGWTWMYAYIWITKTVENEMTEAHNGKVNLNDFFCDIWYYVIRVSCMHPMTMSMLPHFHFIIQY